MNAENTETGKRSKCGMCGYVGTLTDHIGQCPRCHWDELAPAAPDDRDPIHETPAAAANTEAKPTREAADALEAARADAARYRWLRGLDGACDSAACVNFNIGFDWIEQHGDELDAAIDAAMAAEGRDA